MDVPADLDRSLQLQQSRLVDKDLFAFDNDEVHLVVGELHGGPRLLVPHCQQLFNDHITSLIGHVQLNSPPACTAAALRGTREEQAQVSSAWQFHKQEHSGGASGCSSVPQPGHSQGLYLLPLGVSVQKEGALH